MHTFRTIDQLAMAMCVRVLCGHVLRSEDGCLVLRRTKDLVFQGQRKKGRLKMTWKNDIE